MLQVVQVVQVVQVEAMTLLPGFGMSVSSREAACNPRVQTGYRAKSSTYEFPLAPPRFTPNYGKFAANFWIPNENNNL